MRILIVEDDSVSARLLRAIVEPFGEVSIAKDGDEGFNAFQTAFDSGSPFDVVFLDIMMPTVDGQETLAGIRELENIAEVAPEKAAKIIMVSALNDGQNLYEAHKSSCDDYVVKPVRKQAILQILTRLRLIDPSAIPE